jgi:hypothetical protein
MLRRILIAAGVAALLAAFICMLTGVWELAAYLFVVGIALAVGIPLERWRYIASSGRNRACRGDWQLTGERFVDPGSGRLLDVYYNPQTGERDYRDREIQGTSK